LFVLYIIIFAMSMYAQERIREAPSQYDESLTSDAIAETTSVNVEGKGAGKPHHKFPKGYCTWYAAEEFKKRTGRNVTWRGDAKNWITNASAERFRTVRALSTIFLLGKDQIIVFGPTATNSYGHVAVIEFVDYFIKMEITISEMNWKGFGVKSKRIIKFKDLNKLKYIGVILPN
jgi:surface antigen